MTLCQAFKAGDLQMVKRVTALLGITRGERVEAVAGGLGVGPSTVHAWLRTLLLAGLAGSRVQWRGGQAPVILACRHVPKR